MTILEGNYMEDKHRRARLLIDIDEQLHKEAKIRATFRGQSLRYWVELAIKERIVKEDSYMNSNDK